MSEGLFFVGEAITKPPVFLTFSNAIGELDQKSTEGLDQKLVEATTQM